MFNQNLSLVFSPLINTNLLWALAILSLCLIAVMLWRRARGVVWRTLTTLALLAILANPVAREEERDPTPDVVAIVSDRSDSMSLEKRSQTVDAALESLRAQLGRLKGVETRFIEAGAQTFEGTETAANNGTSLFAPLSDALADIPLDRLGGIIMLTDGLVDDATPAVLAKLKDVSSKSAAPLHVLLTGDPKAMDRRLVIEQAPRFGIVDEPVTISFRVDETGTTKEAAQPIPIRLRLDGIEVAATTTLPGQVTDLTFDLPHAGRNVIEIEADTAPGELTEQNNVAVTLTNGIRDRLRVLLVSGEPHPGERTWRNLLKADPAVDLVHFTILRPPDKQDSTPVNELSLIAFPTRELFSLKLAEFDLIIFDRYQRRGVLPITYLYNVADYVENGGAVLNAAGPDFASSLSIYRTPLAAILPSAPSGGLYEGAFRPHITPQGHRHPVTAGLPDGGTPTTDPSWGRWMRLVESEQTSGVSVLTGPNDQPLLLLDRIGEGRVAQLLSDHAWLWSRGFDGGGPQAELLRRLAHWLMKEPDLEEEQLLLSDRNGQLLIERFTMKEEALPLALTYPDGHVETITLAPKSDGVFSAQLDTKQHGLYRADDGELTAITALGPANPKEFQEVVSTETRLAPLVEATQGGVFWLDEDAGNTPYLRQTKLNRDAAGNNWIGLRQNGEYVLRAVKETSLLGPLLALIIAFGFLIGGWVREAR
ncbi:MAG: hypothetical protein P1U50_07645 [Parvibaculaceae bacterium]|nr:hypothetical protein [Parvibaculaceae bacterium]